MEKMQGIIWKIWRKIFRQNSTSKRTEQARSQICADRFVSPFLLQSMDCGDKMIRYSLLQSYYSTAIGLLPAAVLRIPLHSYHFQKIKILYFESDILHTRFADSINSIISTAKRFREMKKL